MTRQKRADCIRDHVKEYMDDMVVESYDWAMPPRKHLDSQPEWAEFRDAIQSWLFDMEHQMGRQAEHSEHVVKECL